MSEGIVLFDSQAMAETNALLAKTLTAIEGVANAVKKTGNEAGQAAEKATSLWKSMGDASRNFNEVMGALHKGVDFVATMGEMAASAEDNARAAEHFGQSLSKVRDAVHGALTDSELMAAHNKILESGMSMTADQFAVVERRARELSVATGQPLNAALEKVTETIKTGSAEQMRALGIELQKGEGRAHAAQRAIEKWTVEQKKAGNQQDTTRESMAKAKIAFESLTSSVVGQIAKFIKLKEVLSGLAAEWQRVGRIGSDLSDVTGNSAADQAARHLSVRSATNGGLTENERRQLGATGNIRALMQAESRSANADAVRQSMSRLVSLGGSTESAGNIQRALGSMSDADLDALATATSAAVGRVQGRAIRGGGLSGNTELAALAAIAARAVHTEATSAAVTNAQRTGVLRAAGLPATTAESIARAVAIRGHNAEDGTAGPSGRDRITATGGNSAGSSGEDHTAEYDAKLRELARKRITGELSRAIAAIAGSSSGQVQSAGDKALEASVDQIAARVSALVRKEQTELSVVQLQLTDRNITLKHRVELEEQANALTESARANIAMLTQLEERRRVLKQAALGLQTTETQQTLTLLQQAIASQDNGLTLTSSENAAMAERVGMKTRLLELETGIKSAIADAGAEGQAATTQEAKNSALSRELQLKMQLAGVEAQRRGIANAEEEQLKRGDFGTQAAKKLLGNLKDTKTTAETFSGVAVDAFNAVGDGLASNLVAVAQGQKSFGQAMSDMLKDFLAMMAKRSVVEVLSNTAAGFAALATYQYPAAASHFAAAGIWGAIGAASFAGLAGVSAATKAPTSSSAPSASAGAASSRSASTGSTPASSNAGGAFSLVVNVQGAAVTDAGVQRAVSNAVERAGIHGIQPAYRTRRALS